MTITVAGQLVTWTPQLEQMMQRALASAPLLHAGWDSMTTQRQDELRAVWYHGYINGLYLSRR